MRLAPTLLLACGLALTLAEVARSQEAQQPYELVRSLRVLQDRAAQGDSAAYGQQRRLSAQIAEQMLAAEPEVWTDPKNVRAAVIYALSGGEPRVLKALFGRRSLPGVEENLLNGALAYSEGRDADAAELLAAIDARSLEPNLGAHVALVQSVMIAAKDATKAMALLDDARLLSPGTLVEEAALRRQALAAAGVRDVNAFNLLASLYMRRFPNSVYANGFREQFAVEVAGDRYGQAPEQLAKLQAMLEGLDISGRRQAYLLIAHQAVIGGRVALARLAARHAVALTTEGSAEHTRSKIYEAAILIVTDDHDAGLAALTSIDRAMLDERDCELLDAAMAVAREVGRPLLEPDPPVSPVFGPEMPLLASVEKAQKIMARVDILLNEVSK